MQKCLFWRLFKFFYFYRHLWSVLFGQAFFTLLLFFEVLNTYALCWSIHFCELSVFEPAFDSYIPQIRMAGGVPVVVPLEVPLDAERSSDYRYDPERLERSITKKTKMIVINNPHNPTGKLFNR